MKPGKNYFAFALAGLAIFLQIMLYIGYEPVTGVKPTVLVQSFPAYFLIINLILHSILLKSAKKSSQVFVRTFMGMTTAKMMISLIFLVIIVFATKPDFKGPAVTFGLFYLLFMVLEVFFVVKDLKHLKDNN